MPVLEGWYNVEESISHWQFAGDWNWGEFFTLLPQVTAKIEQKPYPVAVIMDFTKNQTKTQNAIGMFKSSQRRVAHNVDLIVFAGNAFVRVMVVTFTRLFPSQQYSVLGVSTCEEAHALIHQHRESSQSA